MCIALKIRLFDVKLFGRLQSNVFFVIFLMFINLSCAVTPQYVDKDDVKKNIPVTPSEVELYPGDEIEIKFAYASEFNEIQTIRNDGKIELLLIGEVKAEGKTPKVLRNELIEFYGKHLSHPELAVIIRTSYRNRVYVGGAVVEPGVVNIYGSLTVLNAIMEKGGFDHDTANTKEVLLIRTTSGKMVVYSIDINAYMEGRNNTFIYLQAMDVIYVPRTKITNVASYLEKIWKIIPFRFTASYVFDRSDIEEIFD